MRLLLLLAALPLTLCAEQLTLQQCVARALENSADLRAAHAAQERAHEAYREARAQFIPNLVIGSGLAATRGMPLSIEGSAPSLFQVQSTALVLNQPQRHAIREAQQMWQSAESAAMHRRDQVAYQTAAAYLELHTVQRSMQYGKREIESATKIEQATAERVKEGREIPLEQARARLAVAKLRERTTGLEGRIAVLQQTLRALTGSQTDIETTDSTLAPVEMPRTTEAAIERAIAEQQDLRRLEREVLARESRVKSERAQRWPQFELIGQYAMLSRTNNYDRFFRDFERHNAQLGVAMRFTIFDGNRIGARVGQAEADLAQARATLASARGTVSIDTAKAWRTVQQQEAAREVARLELDVARESLNVSLARFEEGRIPAAELERARSDESARWIAYLDANFQLERARLELHRQTGTLLAALQ